VPGVAVTVPVINGKDEPARLEALQAASDPIGCNRRCVSPTMLSPGGRHPLQHHAAGKALSRRLVVINNVLVAPGTPWTPNPERLVGGRRRVA
jgi:hypothetical protein